MTHLFYGAQFFSIPSTNQEMICHHYKCVFIHIPKTAGQSIESVFLSQLGLRWATRAPLLLRYNDQPELGPPMLAHMKAIDYERYRYISAEQFDEYFKFSFVRNPWDRVVSFYKYLRMYRELLDFKTFLFKKFQNTIWKDQYWFIAPQSNFLCDENGDMVVDFVGRFENLQTDFHHVCENIGLPALDLPHVNRPGKKPRNASVTVGRLAKRVLYLTRGRFIPSFESYRGYYDNESRELVGSLYDRDIALFDFKF